MERPNELPRRFDSREDMAAFLREAFPAAAARDDALSPTRGGREVALAALSGIQPSAYGKTRNHVDGKVSRLSPYLRHGVLTLAEVRDHALSVSGPSGAFKFINELGWRDYWQRVYGEIGEAVWEDREEPKTGEPPFDPAEAAGARIPDDLEAEQSGLACMDGFARELHQTGYLHNHARMWVAAYLIHWLKLPWQAGARWFLTHLLDGDPASNNLSWQWVASTFSRKPYIFNRGNLEKYTDGRYCADCPSAKRCPFDASYDSLNAKLFPYGEDFS